MCNRVSVNSLLFHANNLANNSYEYLPTFIDILSWKTGNREIVVKFLEAIQAMDLSKEDKVNLKDRLTIELNPQSSESVGNLSALGEFIHDFLPRSLAYLKVKDIAQAALVNITFHKAVLQTYTEQLTSPKPSFSLKELRYYNDHILNFDRVEDVIKIMDCTRIRSLDLSHFTGYDETFRQLIKRFPNLTRINLGNAETLSETAIESLINACPYLTAIDLQGTPAVDETTIGLLAERYPHLKEINLSRGNRWVAFADIYVDTLTRSCRALTHIDLSFRNDITNDSLQYIGSRCTHLEALTVDCCRHLSHEGLIHVAQGCPKLHYLGFHSHGDDRTMEVIAKHCRALTTLEIGNSNLTDEGIRTLVATPREDLDLKCIDLFCCTSITATALFSLLERFPNLNSLTLDEDMQCTTWEKIQLMRKYPHLELFKDTSQLLKKELEYIPSSALGKLYQAVLKQDRTVIDPLFTEIKDIRLLEQIHYQVWKLSGEKVGEDWGRLHACDDLDILFQAIRNALEVRVSELFPKIHFDNYTLLADGIYV